MPDNKEQQAPVPLQAAVTQAPPPPPEPTPAPEPSVRPLSLDEFIIAHVREAEVETLGAFRAIERRAGRIVDAADAYLARLHAFKSEQH